MRVRRTNWPVPLVPGLVTWRRTRRGSRFGLGPRWLRVHVGGGPAAVSSSFLWHTWTLYPRIRGNNCKR
jgi:hypothetical protein